MCEVKRRSVAIGGHRGVPGQSRLWDSWQHGSGCVYACTGCGMVGDTVLRVSGVCGRHHSMGMCMRGVSQMGGESVQGVSYVGYGVCYVEWQSYTGLWAGIVVVLWV